MQPQKIIIDTDPGVDDAMAIIYAILNPDVDLIGLTSIFGNVTTEIATRNALVLAEMTGFSIPVARGAVKPLVQEAKEVAWEVHGKEGFGDVPPITPQARPEEVSAHEFICNAVNENPGEVVLCPIGPLTNLALALQHDPSLAEKTKSVAIMGGSLDEGGNVTSHAEANIWQDPHAADIVFAADWDISMIGLDVTHQVICTPEEFSELSNSAPLLGGFLNDAAQYYFKFHRKENGFYGCHMHDPTAVISIIHPEWFSFDELPVEVILQGERVGATVKSENRLRPSSRVAMKIDADAVKHHFLDTVGRRN